MNSAARKRQQQCLLPETEMNFTLGLKQHKDIYRFAKLLMGFRKNTKHLGRRFFTRRNDQNTEANPKLDSSVR